MPAKDELDKAFQGGVKELKQAAHNAHSWALQARRHGDMAKAEQLKQQFLTLNGLLIEVGFLTLAEIDEGQQMQKALADLNAATSDLQAARAQMRSVTQAIEQSAKIIEIVEKGLKTAARFAIV